MKILIVGGTGLIGTCLKKELIKLGYSVNILSRTNNNEANSYLWNINEGYIDLKAFKGVSGVINLTGASIAEKKWSQKRKKILYNSRINTTRLLFDTVKKNNIKLDFFINSSAIGFYGIAKSDKIFYENDDPGTDFLAQLCVHWEKEALKFNELNIRTVIIRTGIVLTKSEGALEKIVVPIKFGIIPIFGTGEQLFSWIHIEDLINIFIISITNKKLKGAFNGVAPSFTTYLEFNKEIANVLNKKTISINTPTFLLNIAFGELSQTLINGNKIASKKIVNEGYEFKYTSLNDALIDLITNS